MKDGIYYITSDGYYIPAELYSEKEILTGLSMSV